MTAEVGSFIGNQENVKHDLYRGCGNHCVGQIDLYTFHYGRKIATACSTGNSIIPHRTYEVKGSYTVLLCRECVRHHHRQSLLKVGLLTGILLILMVVGLTFSGISPFLSILAFMGFIGALLCLGILLGLLSRNWTARGEALAIDLHRQELQRQGFDLFWYSQDYKHLYHTS